MVGFMHRQLSVTLVISSLSILASVLLLAGCSGGSVTPKVIETEAPTAQSISATMPGTGVVVQPARANLGHRLLLRGSLQHSSRSAGL